MQAMVLREFGRAMNLEEVEDPVAGPYDLILRVAACGVCGTDLKIVSGVLPSSVITLPHVPGHEVAGTVVAKGRSVSNIEIGQKGVAYFYVTCGDCPMCRSGKQNLCLHVRRLGFELPGGFAQFVRVPAYNFCPFKGEVSDEAMAVLPDAVATSYRALTHHGKVGAGKHVLVVGTGGLGIHSVQLAALMGARVIAADVNQRALGLACEFGAEHTINPLRDDLVEAVAEITQGCGVETVIENVGSTESIQRSLKCLARGGVLVLVGYDIDTPIQLSGLEMHYNEWSVKGTRVSTKQELLDVIGLVESGRIKPVIGAVFPWEKVHEALAELKSGKLVGRAVLSFVENRQSEPLESRKNNKTAVGLNGR